MKWQPVSGRVAARRVLSVLFDEPPENPSTFDLTPLQRQAVVRARAVLARRGGVFVADRVGMGKTFIGLSLIEDALLAGQHVLVVTPASLRRHWRAPLRKLHEAFSRAPAPLWISHTILSLGQLPTDQPGLVVVDEAHAFRNPQTRRYQALASICGPAKVILLTATPINNSLLDLYFQIRLFASDRAFRDLGVTHLGEVFRSAALAPDQTPPASLLEVLREIVIRRTRIESVADRCAVQFPQRAPPIPVRYSLDDAYPGFLAEALETLETLSLGPYRMRGRGEAGVAELLKLTLLKRLESSTTAFATSIRSVLRFYEAFLDALRSGQLLRASQHRALSGVDGLQLLLNPLVLDTPLPGTDKESVLRACTRDLTRLRSLVDHLTNRNTAREPKSARLFELLDGPLRGRKVLLFTEFRETARSLWRTTRGRGGTGLIDGSSAFLGEAVAGRHEVIRRFAPISNHAAAPPEREAVHLLIATDVLSEGLNLQDAAVVVNFDLPWNPVRLIQRVGRIDRMGSQHAQIECYNFLPDQGLEASLQLLARLRSKLSAIHRGLGGEDAVLSTHELPRTENMIDRLVRGDPDLLDELEKATLPAPGFDQLKSTYTAVRTAVSNETPEGSVCVARIHADFLHSLPGTLWVFAETGADVRAYHLGPGGVSPVAEPSAAQLLRHAAAAVEAYSGPVDTCLLEDSADVLFRFLADRSTVPELPGDSVAGSAARRLLQAIALHPEFADVLSCERVDRIIRGLAAGLRAGEESALRSWLSAQPGLDDPGRLCADLEEVVSSAAARPQHPRLRLLAVFQAI